MDQSVQVAGCASWNLIIGYARLLVHQDDLIFNVFVAGVAGIFRVHAGMAGGANTLTLSSMIEGEVMDLQPGRQPAFTRGMAHLAAQPHKSGMDFRLLMAGRTDNFALLERLSHMAIGTNQLSMLACELKNAGMVKTRHAVNAIVAIGACISKRGHVAGHKFSILESMAFLTGKSCRTIGKGCMALEAGDRVAAETS